VYVSAERLLDLHERVERLAELVPSIRSVALFGSRRFKSGSPRSDVDLLVEFDPEVPSDRELADVVRRVSVYLDIFVVEGSVARSAINGSRIEADHDADLWSMLDAVEVWERDRGVVDTDYGAQQILEDWVPIYSMARPHGDETADREPIDYLIITALADEFSAVEAALGTAVDDERSTKTFGRYLRATIEHAAPNSDETVVVCQSDRMGNVASALTTAEALQRWAPRLTVLVGIAGGLRGKARIGDLVVATQIFDYEASKTTLSPTRPLTPRLISTEPP
jgi:predicted nucleotidyltransferase